MRATVVASSRRAIFLAAGFGIALAAMVMAIPVRADIPAPQMSVPRANAANGIAQRAIGKNLDLALRRPARRQAPEQPAATFEPRTNLPASSDQGRGHGAPSQ